MIPLIILAAGKGTRLGNLTENSPKGMVTLHGRPLLSWHIDHINAAGNYEIHIVGGYQKEKLDSLNVSVTENPDFATTNMVESLLCAQKEFGNEFIVAYGDILYAPEVLVLLTSQKENISVVVDRNWRGYWAQRTDDILSDAESLKIGPDKFIQSIGQKVKTIEEIQAQYIGLIKFKGQGIDAMLSLLEHEREANAHGKKIICEYRNLSQLYMTDLLQGLIDAKSTIAPVEIGGKWFEIDTPNDLDLAQKMTRIKGNCLEILR